MSPKPENSLHHPSIPRSQTASKSKIKTTTNFALGSILAEYTLDKNFLRKRSILRVFFWAALFVLLSGLVLWVYGFSTYGISFASRWSLLAFRASGILLAVGLFIHLTTKHRKTKVHQYGISLWAEEKPALVYKWDDIADVLFQQEEWQFLGKSIYINHLRLRTHKNEKINLARFCSNQYRPELATHIKAKVYKILDPSFRKHLWHNHLLNFGAVGISPQQIIVGKTKVDWKDFTEMNINNGKLLVRLRDGSNHRLPLIKIANFELLLPLAQLAKEIGSLQRKHPN